MKSHFSVEFTYQVFALILAIIIVHAFYVSVVRPNAEAILAEQRERINTDENYIPPRSLYVLVRDYEQESCFILMLWAMAIMAYKATGLRRERALLEQELLPLSEGE